MHYSCCIFWVTYKGYTCFLNIEYSYLAVMLKISKKHIAEEFGSKVSSLAHRMISDKELAKDAAQEAWIEIIGSLDSFTGKSSISTWIYTIAKRTILKHAKHERLITEKQVDHCTSLGQITYDENDSDKKEWVKENCDSCITAFCHCLNNEARLIFLFRVNLKLPYKQISNIMEMEEANIRKIASRSLTKVRNFMTNNCPLLNPKGECRCRIRNEVISINLEKEYQTVGKFIGLANLFLKFDKNLPRKNYWQKLLKLDVTNQIETNTKVV